MPFDFDDEQMPTEAPPEPSVKTIAAVAPPPAPPKPPRRPVVAQGEDPDDELERKMLKMQYYWDIIGNPIFPDTDDEIALEVELEVQAFVRGKLAEVMGSGQKKRGRKPAPMTVFENKGRRATTRANEGRGGGLREAARPSVRQSLMASRAGPQTSVTAVPKGSEATGVEIIQEVTDPNGFKMQRTYRQVLDKASGRSYYLCYVKGSMDNAEYGDGNKYELGNNANGGQYFRVISEQTLPDGVASVKPMTLEAITAASEAHANATMNAIRNSKNNLLSAAIQTALKE